MKWPIYATSVITIIIMQIVIRVMSGQPINEDTLSRSIHQTDHTCLYLSVISVKLTLGKVCWMFPNDLEVNYC